MQVTCHIDEVEMEGDYSPVDGIVATCRRCGHETESFGTSYGSVKRCLVLMRQECPFAESNFYISDDQ